MTLFVNIEWRSKKCLTGKGNTLLKLRFISTIQLNDAIQTEIIEIILMSYFYKTELNNSK